MRREGMEAMNASLGHLAEAGQILRDLIDSGPEEWTPWLTRVLDTIRDAGEDLGALMQEAEGC